MADEAPNLSALIRRGAWSVAAAQVGSQIISLAALALLCRLVKPQDFGAFAIALVLINLARVVASWGIAVAGVQDQQLNDAEQTALFHRGIYWGFIVAAILIALIYPLEILLRESRLSDLIPVLAIVLVVGPLGFQHQVRLERKLQFGRLALCRIGGQLLGAIAGVTLAMLGKEIWALVGQFVVESVAGVVGLWIAEPWRPLDEDERPVNLARFRRFGGHYTASSLLFWVAQNADTLVVGRSGGELAVGLYSQAFNLMMKPVLLTTTAVTGMMLPLLARAVGRPAEYKNLLVGFYRFVGIVLLPCSVGLFVLADDVMLVIGGSRWQAAGVLLRALAPVVAVQGFINIAGSVFASVGKADRLFAGSAAIALLLCQGIVAGWLLGTRFGVAPLGGPLGVAIAYSAVTVGVIFLPYLWFCMRTVGVPLGEVLAALVWPAAAAIIMGVIVWLTCSQLMAIRPGVRVAVGIPLGVVVYVGLMWREILRLLRGGQAHGVPSR